jgi:thiamine-phosphate pyrophosphorylase
LSPETASSSPGLSPADRRLYLITPFRPDLEELLAAAVRGGVDVVQLRDKDVADGELLRRAEIARAVTRALGVPLVVNDRSDLAVLAGAEAVHLGQEDLPVPAARRLGLAVGLSTHAPEEIDRAEADYIGVGPVFATPTKPGRPGTGLDLVRYAAANARVPWFAIGGIDSSNVDAVVAAGARRIAVVRAIGEAADPELAARELRAALPS